MRMFWKEKLLEQQGLDPGLSQAQDIKGRMRCKGWNEIRFIDNSIDL